MSVCCGDNNMEILNLVGIKLFVGAKAMEVLGEHSFGILGMGVGLQALLVCKVEG